VLTQPSSARIIEAVRTSLRTIGSQEAIAGDARARLAIIDLMLDCLGRRVGCEIS
jgi:hypothetical protein